MLEMLFISISIIDFSNSCDWQQLSSLLKSTVEVKKLKFERISSAPQLQNICLVTKKSGHQLLYSFGKQWSRIIISCSLDFEPKISAKKCGLYTSFYGRFWHFFTQTFLFCTTVESSSFCFCIVYCQLSWLREEHIAISLRFVHHKINVTFIWSQHIYPNLHVTVFIDSIWNNPL